MSKTSIFTGDMTTAKELALALLDAQKAIKYVTYLVENMDLGIAPVVRGTKFEIHPSVLKPTLSSANVIDLSKYHTYTYSELALNSATAFQYFDKTMSRSTEQNSVDEDGNFVFVVHNTASAFFAEKPYYGALEHVESSPIYYAHYYTGQAGQFIKYIEVDEKAPHCANKTTLKWDDGWELKSSNSYGIGVEMTNCHTFCSSGKSFTGSDDINPLRQITWWNTARERTIVASRSGKEKVIRDAYSLEQVALCIRIMLEVSSAKEVKTLRIIGHENTNTTEKVDPGSHFPWGLVADVLAVFETDSEDELLAEDDVNGFLSVDAVNNVEPAKVVLSAPIRTTLDFSFHETNILTN